MKKTRIALATAATLLFIASCSQHSDGTASGTTAPLDKDAVAASEDAEAGVSCDEPFVVPDGCLAAACEMAECGAPTSFVDENLCERKRCESSDDCEAGEECKYLQYLRPFCGTTHPDEVCRCGSHDLNSYDWLCMPQQPGG